MYALIDIMKVDTFAWVEWMIAERQRREWSQADLARKADVTRQTINDYESRRRANPDPRILSRISEVLGFPPEHLPRMAGLLPPSVEMNPEIKQISSKRAKTDADYEEMARIEFLAGLYLDESGPILPAYMIEAAILGGAKKSKEGQASKSGCFCLEHARLEYDGPRQANELWEDERFRFSAIVRVQTSRVSRMRPVFREWSAIIDINIEDTLVNPARVDEWLTAAGSQVGLGDWRPQYGRFTAERTNSHK